MHTPIQQLFFQNKMQCITFIYTQYFYFRPFVSRRLTEAAQLCSRVYGVAR